LDVPPEWVTLARIERSRGRRGEVLATLFTSGPERFNGIEVLLGGPDGPRPDTPRVRVENAWLHDGRLVLKFAGVDSIEDAERLRGLDVCVPLSERAPLGHGEVYFTDLVGCELADAGSGEPLGRVEGWQETAGAPVLLEVLAPGGGEILVPFVREICVNIDTVGRRILARLPEGLAGLNPR